MTNRTRLAALAVLLGTTLTGCGDDPPTTYAPAAYGEVIGGQGRCYYIQDQDEASALLTAGLCPAGWIAYPAPPTWEETYWDWYSSPSYYSYYVPAARRTTYTTVTVVHFHADHAADISRLSKTATYKGSDGRTVTGPKAGTVKFGGGNRVAPTLGGGNARTGAVGGAPAAPASKGAAPAKPPAPKTTRH